MRKASQQVSESASQRKAKAMPGLLLGVLDGGPLERRVVRLLDSRVPWARRWRWAAMVGCVAMMGMLSTGLVVFGVRPVLAQILHASGPLPSFEVATIKRAGDGPVAITGAKNVLNSIGTTKAMIEGAYNIPYGADDRLIGGPSWVNSDRYIVQGKLPDELFAKWQTMPVNERRTQGSLMKQALLADRFKLKVHFEMRELPVYELVVVKGGAKLKLTKPVDPNAPPAATGPLSAYYMDRSSPEHSLIVNRNAQGALEMTTTGMTPAQVAADLIGAAGDDLGGRTVVNKTGLDGQYDFTLKWAPQQTASAPGADNASPENEAPSIFTALEEQLGLKLVPAKGMVEVVVIDSIERPTEN